MPEMLFHLQWPDGSTQVCYSPSLVVAEHLTEGAAYPVPELLARTRTALGIASDRVQARYGFPCSRAQGQLAAIEARAALAAPDGAVRVTRLQT